MGFVTIAGGRTGWQGRPMSYSNYIVYVDESGDHGLDRINPQYPVFTLCFCIVEKGDYLNRTVPAMQTLKFAFWGHDCVVLHAHDIRKARGDFSILLNPTIRERFLAEVNSFIANTRFTIIASVIDKQRLAQRYAHPANPYEVALEFCLERLQRWLTEHHAATDTTFVIVERRGQKEDDALELEFRRIAAGKNAVGAMPNLDIRFMDKRHNSTGLQLADLAAHPIGRHVMNPQQPNRAFDVLEPKFRRSAAGKVSGYGLKTFP